jgi:hypothetical protein
MGNIHIPSGEVGSVNYYAKMVLDDLKGTSLLICNQTQLCLNVIWVLKERAGSDLALRFAEQVIKDLAH